MTSVYLAGQEPDRVNAGRQISLLQMVFVTMETPSLTRSGGYFSVVQLTQTKQEVVLLISGVKQEVAVQSEDGVVQTELSLHLLGDAGWPRR